jgi:hypothetical protein
MWWKRRRVSSPRTEAIPVRTASCLRMPGWRLIKQSERIAADADGDALSLTEEQGGAGLPHLSDIDAVRRYGRTVACGARRIVQCGASCPCSSVL